MELREVTYLAVALRIFASVLIGGLLGWERGLKNRAAGLRTHMLVCVGACLVMVTNQYIYQVFGSGDPVRMGAQVVSGIGFLGAGTIIVTRRQIKGLTTAAGLWTAAGVGLALGIGFYEAALAAAAAVLLIMTVLHRLDNRMHRKSKSVEMYIELDAAVTLGDVLRQVRDRGYEAEDLQKASDASDHTQAFILCLKAKQRIFQNQFMEDIQELDGVRFVEIL